MKVRDLIVPFLDDFPEWADLTKKRVGISLRQNCHLISEKPQVIYKDLLSRYSERTALTVAAHLRGFIDYCIENERIPAPNHFRAWCSKNLKKKNSKFRPRLPTISFEEARELILKIPESRYKQKAMQLLYGGLRFTESFTLDSKTKSVIGKGGKERRVYIPNELYAVRFEKSDYRSFTRRLQEIGLRPHDLRKIRATQLARSGMDVFTLKEIFGWSKLETAEFYVTSQATEIASGKMISDLPIEEMMLDQKRLRKCS